MLDLAFFALWCWCALWIALAGRRRALLYGGGVSAASYVASVASGWLVRIFAPQSGAVMTWLTQHIDIQAATRTFWFPPVPAGTSGVTAAGWAALQIVRAIAFVWIVTAVLLLFVVVAYLRDALWDVPDPHRPDAVSVVLGMAAGGWMLAVLAWLVARLSWLDSLHGMTEALDHSLWLHAVIRMVDHFAQMPGVL
jgi:hypothetical protein